MITTNNGYDYTGLSSDAKPEGLKNGATFYEIDTQDLYMYDEQNELWIKQ